MSAVPKEFFRDSQITSALEQICQSLELTQTQQDLAKSHYEAVGAWLGDSENPLLRELIVYPHGSVALGTSVKPRGRLEHDVDVVSRAVRAGLQTPPTSLKGAIGDRLKEHAYYATILEEKRRCWRLNYAGEFHLDITPAILNPACENGGELVPDKELRGWKATNPQGFRRWFEQVSQLQPRIRFVRAFTADSAEVAPFPRPQASKGVLRRTVQISKRHRDICFEIEPNKLAPISIIITTLLARAYAVCVLRTFDSELQLIIEMVRVMPSLIEGPTTTGHSRWAVWNPTTQGENFAEKWNSEPARATAFFSWHSRLLSDLERLTTVFGLDQLSKSLSESFGPKPAKAVMDAMTRGVSTARAQGTLSVVPQVGLSAAASAAGTSVRRNTFFGAE